MSCDFCHQDTVECCECEKECCDDCACYFEREDGISDTTKPYCPDCYEKEEQRREDEEAETANRCQVCGDSARYIANSDTPLRCSLCEGVTCSEHLGMFAGGRICPKCAAERRDVLGVPAA
jgi:hypothetical protein